MTFNEKRARTTPAAPEFAQSEAAHLPGEFFALLEQIGAPELADFSLDASLGGNFLESYLAKFLLPVELPAIAEACGHALRGELRELIAQDRQLGTQIAATRLAASSRRIGQLQLARLLPLRDNRLVQRYHAAVQCAEADGWHTMVYGVTLALFSIPLRQGLVHYGQATLASFAKTVHGESGPSHLESLLAQLPGGVESALSRC
jgi:hypothetical protein